MLKVALLSHIEIQKSMVKRTRSKCRGVQQKLHKAMQNSHSEKLCKLRTALPEAQNLSKNVKNMLL